MNIEINFRSAIEYLEDFSLCFSDTHEDEAKQDLIEFEAIIWAFYCTKAINKQQFDHFIDEHSKFSEYLDSFHD